MLILMMRLVIPIVFTEYLCVIVLVCTILVKQPNKILDLITHTIRSLYVLYCMVFKNMYFWCDTKSKLYPGFYGGISEVKIKLTEKFCIFSAYLFKTFIVDIASTATFQKNKQYCIISSGLAMIQLTHIPLI